MDILERSNENCDGFIDKEEFPQTISSFRWARKKMFDSCTRKLKDLFAMTPSTTAKKKMANEVYDELVLINMLNPTCIKSKDLIQILQQPGQFPGEI